LLSIGGWSYSSNFATPASTALGRSAFALSAVSLVKSLGLDGIDIDWEYPGDDIEATNIVELLQTVRACLDAYGQALNPPYHFTLTVACPAGPSNYQKLHVADMDQYLDFWNFMAYDYAGNWSTVTGNQTNLFSSVNNSASTPFDIQTEIDYYISKGIPANKIVLGMPIYGRSFNATSRLGMPFIEVG
jgi:chitinase